MLTPADIPLTSVHLPATALERGRSHLGIDLPGQGGNVPSIPKGGHVLLHAALTLTLLVGVAAPALAAQTEARIGDRVRITSAELPEGRSVGILERSAVDSVVLSGRSIARSSVRHIEVSTGRKSHGLAGMGIGLLAGAGISAGLSCISYCGDVESEYLIAPISIFGGLLGAFVGGLVGQAVKSDRWAPTSLGTLSLQPTAGPGSPLGIRVSLRL